MARFTFTDTEQHALRLTDWRVTPEQADRAWSGGIVATVHATGGWAVTEKGNTVAIGAGDNAILDAMEALEAASKLKGRRILAQLA